MVVVSAYSTVSTRQPLSTNRMTYLLVLQLSRIHTLHKLQPVVIRCKFDSVDNICDHPEDATSESTFPVPLEGEGEPDISIRSFIVNEYASWQKTNQGRACQRL